jgi:DMSO/TMAO reductase YedYZ molybdopterin-dependent catalytic subunit
VPLYVVRHRHEAASCPAEDPEKGAQLLNWVSRPNARRRGIEIHGEAVPVGAHALYMILEAPDDEHVRLFMQPFAQVGSVEIDSASTCARVVASGSCAVPAAATDVSGPALDPEEACQRAIDAGLIVHRAHPLNGETSIQALLGGQVMPNAHFYVRNHFQLPDLDPTTWRLSVSGLVERKLSLSLADLHGLPSQSLIVTLECAGNGRAMLSPRVDGEQWALGAVSTAEWTGVPLVEVLDRAGIRPGAREAIFRGADSGSVDGREGTIHFERSLAIGQARDSEVLLAYAMNGEPLPHQHGFPVRLVVPGWYGVASVKWLTEIEVVKDPFTGFYQADRYIYEWQRDGGIVREPVTLQRVRSLITEPGPDDEVERGELAVRGVAWSGAAPIARVEVSLDSGPWQEARLVGERNRHGWIWWETFARVDRPGALSVRARATDLAGRTQPEEPEWNRLGYGSNAVQVVPIHVR